MRPVSNRARFLSIRTDGMRFLARRPRMHRAPALGHVVCKPRQGRSFGCIGSGGQSLDSGRGDSGKLTCGGDRMVVPFLSFRIGSPEATGPSDDLCGCLSVPGLIAGRDHEASGPPQVRSGCEPLRTGRGPGWKRPISV